MRFPLIILACCAAIPAVLKGQAPTQPAPKASPKTAAKPGEAPVPSPVSKHYPILVIAHGNEPFWSLRLGMKGPERLDRVRYPAIVLEPGEITTAEPGKAWTYKAKDTATGADVAVKLTREPCSDTMSDTKYTFRVAVEDAQIGTLNGCGQSEPDKFPEFRKKNQLDPDENAAADDKDKKTVLDPITNFKPPVATAYLDAAGRVVLSRGEVKKAVAIAGTELALSHDGKKLLYTQSDSKTGPERSIVLYDADTGKPKDLLSGTVRQAFWSPDDSRVAFLKFDGQKWQVWTLPAGAPEKAAVGYPEQMLSLHGWTSPDTVLAVDAQNAYWIGEDGKIEQTVPLKDIYGDGFQIMSRDTIRVNPVNPDLLLVSAFHSNVPTGAPTDAAGLNSSFFLYEVKSKRRVVLGPTDNYARFAEWSREGLQIFFTRGVPGKGPLVTWRIFWDGSGLKRSEAGSDLVIGK